MKGTSMLQNKLNLDVFVKASPYRAPVDIKKLKFIFLAVDHYVSYKKRSIENLRILEVGCGMGGITLPLASLGCQVRGFDIDKDSVEHVQAQIERNGIKNLIVTVDNGYTFHDGKSYDIIIVSDVFEHVLEPSKLLANIVRKMAVGSYLVITTPNGYGPWELRNSFDPRTYLKKWNLLRRLFGKNPYIYGSGGDHCQFYSKGRLVKLFSNSCLRLVKFGKSDSLLVVISPLRESVFFGNIDIRLADLLPYWLASGWYFVCELQAPSRVKAS
jgi:2-polyprenyl-3-methyl-5-hydroxy-6-metoxy-1,4-benzoquinol methylase